MTYFNSDLTYEYHIDIRTQFEKQKKKKENLSSTGINSKYLVGVL